MSPHGATSLPCPCPAFLVSEVSEEQNWSSKSPMIFWSQASILFCFFGNRPHSTQAEVLASIREVGILSQRRGLKESEDQLPHPVRFCWELSGHGELVQSSPSSCLIVVTLHLRTVILKPFEMRWDSFLCAAADFIKVLDNFKMCWSSGVLF